MPAIDDFGNAINEELSYATGDILATAEHQYDEAIEARRIIRERWGRDGATAIYNFSGLERGFPARAADLAEIDDESAPALYAERFTERALDHLGGIPSDHDVFLANRMTAATMSVFTSIVPPASTVIGIAPNTSHASVKRAAALVNATFIDTHSYDEYTDVVSRTDNPSLVVLSRLDVTYEHFSAADVTQIIELAKQKGVTVYMDDAGGARVLPALFDHPRSLEVDVDIVSTGLDKYGVDGPRFGLMGGNAALVRQIRSQAWKLGLEARPSFIIGALRSLEAYDPQRVRDRYEITRAVGNALSSQLGDAVQETDSISKVTGADILRIAMDRGGIRQPPLVPIEATGALSMLLLRDYGILTVHFVGIPSGTPDFLLKFMPPAEVERFGGPETIAAAVDDSISKLADLLADPEALRTLLVGHQPDNTDP